MNKFFNGLVPLAAIVLLLPSCRLLNHKRSKKNKSAAAIEAQKIDSLSRALKKDTLALNGDPATLALIQETAPIWQSKVSLQTLSTKARMHYEGADKSYDFVANIRMRKDSVIWVSVTVAGIVQVARALITPDSFKAVLYTEKEAYQGPNSMLSAILPAGIDFYSLQNLILGNPILQQSSIQTVLNNGSEWAVRFAEKNYAELVLYSQMDSSLTMNQLISQDSSHRTLAQALSTYSIMQGKKIATDRKINILNDGNAMSVEMNLSNIIIDNELSYPFSIPQNYTLK